MNTKYLQEQLLHQFTIYFFYQNNTLTFVEISYTIFHQITTNNCNALVIINYSSDISQGPQRAISYEGNRQSLSYTNPNLI